MDDLATARQQAEGIRLPDMPQPDITIRRSAAIRLNALALALGEDPAQAANRALGSKTDAELNALNKQYVERTIESFKGKKPDQLSNEQLNLLATTLATKEDGRSWPHLGDVDPENSKDLEREADRKRELIQALNEIYDKAEDQQNAFANHIRGYGAGPYIGGDNGMSRDKLTAVSEMGDVGKDLADRYSSALQPSADGRQTMAEFAKRFVGFTEEGHNGGPLVTLAMGYQGDPYCAGGINMLMDRVYGPALFDQKDFRMASSWPSIAQAHGAYSNSGRLGDVAIFSGSGPSGYHLGVVSEVDANGNPSKFIDFNGRNNGVDEKSFANRAAIAFVDVETLARAKGLLKDGEGLNILAEKAQKEFEQQQNGIATAEITDPAQAPGAVAAHDATPKIALQK